MPKIENFISKKKLFKSSIEDDFGNTKNIRTIMDALTSTQKFGVNNASVELLNMVMSEKNGDKVETNRRQTEDKPETNRRQSRDKPKTNRRQTGDKVETKLKTNIQQDPSICLSPIQLKIMLFFLDCCKLNRSRYTGQLSVISIANSCKIKELSVKKTLQRLESKHIIIRNFFKNGRGGWTIYEIPTNVFEELLIIETQYKLETKLETEPYSSSSYINTTTSYSEIPSEPPPINVVPLQDIGLTQSHILQFTKANKLTIEQIQDSINFFAFDLTHNNKANSLKKSPLDFFMGILRQGYPYAAPANYESLDTQAIRLYLESKQQAEQMAETWETQARDRLFQEWQTSLSSEQLEAFCVEITGVERLSEQTRATLKQRNALNQARQYFETTIWPEKRKSILEKN